MDLEDIKSMESPCWESGKCIENNKPIEREYPDYSYRKRVNFLYTQISGYRCKKYQCLLCNFETQYLSSIQKHFMRHSNTRPYSCQNCEFAARATGDLKRHTLFGCGKPQFTSSGEYQCNLCEYCTSKKRYLQQHMRCHTREKPFSCDKCDYRSSRNCNLAKHKLTHTKRKKTFVCGECNRSYVNKASLTTHIRSKHCTV